MELGIPIREDPAIGGHQPVSPSIWSGGHADDGLIEMNAASGMAQGIMGEAAGLMADIAVVMQKPGAAANPQDVLKALGNIKVN